MRYGFTGHGNIPIKLEYITTDTSLINNVNTITIYSNYLLAWHNFLNDTLLNADLTYGAGGMDDFIILENDEEITIDFNDALLSVDITLRIIDIDIKIGPGWLDI